MRMASFVEAAERCSANWTGTPAAPFKGTVLPVPTFDAVGRVGKVLERKVLKRFENGGLDTGVGAAFTGSCRLDATIQAPNISARLAEPIAFSASERLS